MAENKTKIEVNNKFTFQSISSVLIYLSNDNVCELIITKK